MTDQADTLSAFFGLDDPARVRASSRALQNAPEIKRASMLPAALRGPAADAIMLAAKTLLSDPISGVIVGAWSKLRDLDRFRSAPAGELNEMTLHEHEIALARKPSIELVLNGAPTGVQLNFELKVGLTLEGAVLKFRDARIIGADISRLRGGGSFSLGQVTIAERKTESYRLPGKLAFNPGVTF